MFFGSFFGSLENRFLDSLFMNAGLLVSSIHFEQKKGSAHAPADSIMLVKDYGVLFSGDVIYKGRVPFLDSPETDTKR